MDKVLTFTSPQGDKMNVSIIFVYSYDSETGREGVGIWDITPEYDWLTTDMIITEIFESI